MAREDMRVTRLVITDGRADMLTRMLESFDKHVQYDWHETIIVNDAGTPAYTGWLTDLYPDCILIHHATRRGLAQAIRSGWAAIDSTETDYVIHLEDDCVFTVDTDIHDWVYPLTVEPHLAQVCLQRGPQSPDEHAAGGILQLYRDRYGITECDGWTEQSYLFSLQPNIYRASLTDHGWPEHGGEREFTDQLPAGLHGVDDSMISFGYLDGIGAEPRYEHAGFGIRMPGWTV